MLITAISMEWYGDYIKESELYTVELLHFPRRLGMD
jgi:hypothetical protein